MIDLTHIITDITCSYNDNWYFNDFFIVINILKNNELEISYWEDEENWASVINNDKIVGYLWHNYPLLFIEYRYSDIVNDFSDNYKFEVIFVNSVYTDLFKMDNKLITVFDNFINLNSFTAEDLWFYTNSK
ncbi:hypothetical protein [Empedobacter brevis]|uniref:Uncharacterized protein n=1 Tax=Empedobacter brevis NBRC 14943 = ATCC 43319 TaxID=1218108 RepID=A0A511NK95_9FLAO|nr:hypothetical protein [Empedobacter brevis]GEM53204.1 hypothetical protein EB1_29940 [Empedobacter brevis NBRC 14943 = ATCC 43319]